MEAILPTDFNSRLVGSSNVCMVNSSEIYIKLKNFFENHGLSVLQFEFEKNDLVWNWVMISCRSSSSLFW